MCQKNFYQSEDLTYSRKSENRAQQRSKKQTIQSNLSKIETPLWCYILNSQQYIKIHMFDDASSVAYGAVSFLRIMEKNDIKCKFVLAKLRLCLIKETR